MTTRITRETLVSLVHGDEELVALLIEEGLLPDSEDEYGAEEIELLLCSYTLVRELDVNVPGVEIILRLRRELAMARRALAGAKDD